MHPRNFASEKIVSYRVHPHVRPPLHVSRDEILHFKHPRVLTVNRIPSRTFRDDNNNNNNNKADSLLRLNFNVYIDADDRERARAKGKKQGDQFRWKKNITILYITTVRKRGKVSGHQSGNERQRK